MRNIPKSIKLMSLMLLAFILIIMPLAGVACDDDEETTGDTQSAITIKLASPYAEADITGDAAKKFKELVEAKCDNITIELNWNQSLSTHAGQFEALEAGAVHAAIQSPGYLRGYDVNLDIPGTLQGLMITKEHCTAVWEDPTVMGIIEGLFEESNIKYLDYMETYLIFGYFSQTAMDDGYDDFDGKKYYTGRPGDEEPFEAMMGVERVYVDRTEAAAAIENGDITLQPMPVTWAATGAYASWNSVLLRPYWSPNLILFNMDKWNDITEENQEIIMDEVMPAVREYTSSIVVEAHKEAVKTLVDNLDSAYVVSPASENAAWDELEAYSAFTTLAANVNQTLFNRIIEIRPDYTEFSDDMLEILAYAGLGTSSYV